jgi:hypothetical protein
LKPRSAPSAKSPRAVHVQGQPRELAVARGVVSHVSKQLSEAIPHLERRLLERVGHGAIGREPLQPGKAKKQRVALEIPKMPKPRAAEQQHAHQRQRDPKGAVVAVEAADREDSLQPLREARAVHEASEQLEASVGAELLLGEHNRQIALDTAPDCPFP